MDTLRNLYYMARRFRVATVLNAVGLTVALVAFYLFMTQVVYNHEYNRALTHSERLYRLEFQSMWDDHDWQPNANRMFAECVERLPQVESLGFVQMWEGGFRFVKEGTEMEMPAKGCSDGFVRTMAPLCLSGELDWKEDDRHGIILPRSMALQYFGEVDVAGRRMMRDNGDSVLVRGVYEDFPANTLAKNMAYWNIGDENKDNFSNFNYQCYVRLRAEVDTVGLDETISHGCYDVMKQTAIAQGMGDELEEEEKNEDFQINLHLRPLHETYFSGVDPATDRGNRSVDLILRLACVMVIVVGSINFLNFMLAEAPMRVRSVNTRRILGSPLWQLRLSLVGEALLVGVGVFVLAMAVMHLLSEWPYLRELAAGSIALKDHLWLMGATLAVALLMGLVAGVYPAWYVTSFQPALALKGSFGLTPRGKRLRTGLIALQLVIACVMVVYLGILGLQSRLIYRSDYGFEKDEVLYCAIWDILDKKEALRSEVLKLTGVEEVSFSEFVIGTQDTYMGWGRGDDEHQVSFVCMPCDWRYLRTMGIEVEEGRDFQEHDQDVYIINHRMKEACDWVELDKPLLKDEGPVVGVCSNVRYASVRVDRGATNLAFYIMGPKFAEWGDQLNKINIRVGKNIDKIAVMRQVKALADSMNEGKEHDVYFLDQLLQRTYEDEFRFMRQVLLFSFLTLVVTLIGIFCLTLFETEYRRKEIGIRKIMGSTTAQVLRLFLGRYAAITACVFLVAAPLAYLIGSRWLQNFAERTPIYWWLFPLALAAVSLVTLGTVALQSLRAANENPINSIKNE